MALNETDEGDGRLNNKTGEADVTAAATTTSRLTMHLGKRRNIKEKNDDDDGDQVKRRRWEGR